MVPTLGPDDVAYLVEDDAVVLGVVVRAEGFKRGSVWDAGIPGPLASRPWIPVGTFDRRRDAVAALERRGGRA
jgi:hypothetical protein